VVRGAPIFRRVGRRLCRAAAFGTGLGILMFLSFVVVAELHPVRWTRRQRGLRSCSSSRRPRLADLRLGAPSRSRLRDPVADARPAQGRRSRRSQRRAYANPPRGLHRLPAHSRRRSDHDTVRLKSVRVRGSAHLRARDVGLFAGAVAVAQGIAYRETLLSILALLRPGARDHGLPRRAGGEPLELSPGLLVPLGRPLVRSLSLSTTQRASLTACDEGRDHVTN